MTDAPYFNVESDTLGTWRVSGVISFANAASALAGLPPTARDGSPVTVDLKALENADSATLAVLIAWAARMREARTPMRFSNAPQGLRNLARLCDVEGLLGLA
ncbi:MAG TPA: STAS domain-containing protein [Rudaea sp.]